MPDIVAALNRNSGHIVELLKCQRKLLQEVQRLRGDLGEFRSTHVPGCGDLERAMAVQRQLSIAERGAFPKIVYGRYAATRIEICDRNAGIVYVRNHGGYYISPDNNMAWEVVRILTETTDDNGFALLSGCTDWQRSFCAGKVARIPDHYQGLGLGDVRAFYRLIRPEGRTGRFRIAA